MVRSRNRITPVVGTTAPAMRLKRVLFPAPFGPMMPTISPPSTVKLTSRMAHSDPNWRPTASSLSIIFSSLYTGGKSARRRDPGHRAADRAGNTGREVENDDNDDDAINDEVKA